MRHCHQLSRQSSRPPPTTRARWPIPVVALRPWPRWQHDWDRTPNPVTQPSYSRPFLLCHVICRYRCRLDPLHHRDQSVDIVPSEQLLRSRWRSRRERRLVKCFNFKDSVAANMIDYLLQEVQLVRVERFFPVEPVKRLSSGFSIKTRQRPKENP